MYLLELNRFFYILQRHRFQSTYCFSIVFVRIGLLVGNLGKFLFMLLSKMAWQSAVTALTRKNISSACLRIPALVHL